MTNFITKHSLVHLPSYLAKHITNLSKSFTGPSTMCMDNMLPIHTNHIQTNYQSTLLLLFSCLQHNTTHSTLLWPWSIPIATLSRHRLVIGFICITFQFLSTNSTLMDFHFVIHPASYTHTIYTHTTFFKCLFTMPHNKTPSLVCSN